MVFSSQATPCGPGRPVLLGFVTNQSNLQAAYHLRACRVFLAEVITLD